MIDLLKQAVGVMQDAGAQFCDARYQKVNRTNIQIVDGGVRSLAEDRTGGLCLRARHSGSWGYASISDLDKKEVFLAAERAASNARLGGAKGIAIPSGKAEKRDLKAGVQLHPLNVTLEEKLSLVKDLEKAQRISPQIVNSTAVYLDSVKTNWLVNSFGSELQWEEVRGRLFGQPVASDGERTELFYNIVDGTKGFEMFKSLDLDQLGRYCGNEAVKMLSAKKCPSGEQVCITDPAVSGLLAHEVMGHASEADEIIKNRSFLSTVVGKKVASELITMVDDGGVEGAYGSIPFDDEGTPSSRTTIIENGVYKGYMHSLETAAEMKVRPTGNGRAQDPFRRVFVRMSNTFFEAGDWKLEEMLEDVKFGVLTDLVISGMEDPVGGGFEGKALRGYLIENGKVTDMLRSFTLTGKALEILKTTDAVGKEIKFGGGTCGKGNEDYVPVSDGGPHCRSRIILGGG
ncbi:MAG: TldD/PmbA family protein [Methanomassiliicoccales archaeon]|nr:TldD/PmbA family protein [Methanomassiliicoccales archaeon]